MSCSTSTLMEFPNTSKALTEYDWSEIAKHNNSKDCWIVIDGYVCDVTSWIEQHPGGKVLSVLAGEDATAMFYSNHLMNGGGFIDKFCIGRVNNYQSEFNIYNDNFYAALKKRVINYFKENNIDYRTTKNNYRKMSLTALLLFSSWACMYFLPPWGIVAAIPMGLATCSLIGTFGHEYIHGNLFTGISRKPGYWIFNNILWGLFIPFMPERFFQYEHIKHHNYPMHPENDYDVFALKDFVRLSPSSEKKPQHTYQHLYAPLTYGIYIFLQLIGGYRTSFFNKRDLLKEKGALRDIILSSLVAFSFHIALPIYLTSVSWVILSAGIYFFTWQFAIYFSSGLPHMTDVKSLQQETDSWAHHVCLSTKNIQSGGVFFNWLTGGLNNHLTHHLLPSIPQEHLNGLAPLVEKTCDEYGYQYYNYNSLKEYYRDHYMFLVALGK